MQFNKIFHRNLPRIAQQKDLSKFQSKIYGIKILYHFAAGDALYGGRTAQLRWDGGGIGPDATALQASMVFGGRQYIGKEDFLTWNISFGRGSGENIMAFVGSHANAVLNNQGNL